MTMLRMTGKAALLAATMASTGALAQAAVVPAGAAPDVVDAAAPNTAPVQDAASTVSVFSADGLEARGIQSTLQLGPFVPNMLASNTPGLGSSNSYYIRGVGNTQTFAGFDPAVGTYIAGRTPTISVSSMSSGSM